MTTLNLYTRRNEDERYTAIGPHARRLPGHYEVLEVRRRNASRRSASRRTSSLAVKAGRGVGRKQPRMLAIFGLIVFLIVTLTIGSNQAFGQNPTFATPVNLSNTPTGNAQSTHVAAVGNNVYTAWQDDVLGKPNLYFRASSNNGTTFGSVLLLSSNVGWAQTPQVAVSGSSVYVAWKDNSTSSFKIYVRSSSNNGASFSPSINVGTTANVDESGLWLSASGNNVYIAWLENAHTPVIDFKASSNYGNSFGSLFTVSGSGGTSFPPVMVVSGANVYIAWRQNVATGNDDVFFRTSSTNGTSFGSIVNLSSNPGESFDPVIAAYGNSVYAAWPDNTGLSSANFDIFFRASTNNGASFSTVVNVSNNTGTSIEPQIAAYANSVYLCWQDSTPGNPDILYRASNNNGAVFGGTVNLSNNPGTSKDPRITSSGSGLYVVWDDTTTATGVDDTFFTSSDNSGTNFGGVLNLSNNSGFSTLPHEAAHGSNVYVVWQDETPSPGFNQVFFTVGTPTVTVLPTAYNGSWSLPLNQPTSITLSGYDQSGHPLTFSIVSGPAHGVLGSITSIGPSSALVTYTPSANYQGGDSFSFKVNNGSLDSAPGTVSITVVSYAVGVRRST